MLPWHTRHDMLVFSYDSLGIRWYISSPRKTNLVHGPDKAMMVVGLVQRLDGADAGVLHGGAAVPGRGRGGRLHLLIQRPDRLRFRDGHRELVPYEDVASSRSAAAPGARGRGAGGVEAARLVPPPRRGRRGRGGRVEVRGLARGGSRGDGPGARLRLGLGPRLAGPPRGHRAAPPGAKNPRAGRRRRARAAAAGRKE